MKRVLFLFGGQSNEHEVSILSAQSVYTHFPFEDYICIPVYIDKNGKWHKSKEVAKEIDVNLFTENVEPDFHNIDILYPLIHGATGEDGVMQRLAKENNLLVVGPNIETAEKTFDKEVTKKLVNPFGVKVANAIVWNKGEMYPRFPGGKIFVKPARSGSSVGISSVTSETDFSVALEKAGKEGSKVLVEEAIVGREVEVAVFVTQKGEKYISSVIGEILPPEDTFYTYEEKYDKASKTGLVVGAKVSENERKNIYETVDKVIEALNIVGSARVDMFLPEDGVPVLNEVNTIPGFTNISMYPKLFEASGLPFKDLVKLMIDNAN